MAHAYYIQIAEHQNYHSYTYYSNPHAIKKLIALYGRDLERQYADCRECHHSLNHLIQLCVTPICCWQKGDHSHWDRGSAVDLASKTKALVFI